MALTSREALTTRRIREALGALGYPVPPSGTGTLTELAAMAPSIARFARDAGPAFLAAVRRASSPLERAELVAAQAEATVRALGPLTSVVRAASAVRDGLEVYARMRREVDALAGFVGIFTNR
jgi:hypothetical protein